jgi:hypothetical protein
VSQPASPVRILTYKPCSGPYRTIEAIGVSSNYLYFVIEGYDVRDDDYGLYILDITSPANPARIGFSPYFLSGFWFLTDIDLYGSYILGASWGIMRVWDISDVSDPVGDVPAHLAGGTAMSLVGNRAYFADSGGVVIYDSSDADPFEWRYIGGYVDTNGPFGMWSYTCTDVKVQDCYAFLPMTDPGFWPPPEVSPNGLVILTFLIRDSRSLWEIAGFPERLIASK